MYRKIGKRLLDVICSGLALILLSPVMLVCIVLIRRDSDGPAIFRQRRVGYHKQEFSIFKFRTMYIFTPSDLPTRRLQNPNQYITRFGRHLRTASLDELPQLVNILVGQMSLIGPRPVVPKEKALIDLREAYGANDVRPGLSGLAQVNGRDELDYPVKAQYDGEYVKRMCFTLDVKIAVRTIIRVIKRHGIVEGRPGAQPVADLSPAPSPAAEGEDYAPHVRTGRKP